MGVADVVLGLMVVALFVLGFVLIVALLWGIVLGFWLLLRRVFRRERTEVVEPDWY